jgi:hypothetical protein
VEALALPGCIAAHGLRSRIIVAERLPNGIEERLSEPVPG